MKKSNTFSRPWDGNGWREMQEIALASFMDHLVREGKMGHEEREKYRKAAAKRDAEYYRPFLEESKKL